MEFKKILCAIDLAGSNGEVVNYAKSFARSLNAVVEVVYVQTEPSIDVKALGMGEDAKKMPAEKALALKMKEFMAANFADVPARAHIALGKAGNEIVRLARETDSSFIVMGSHARVGLVKFVCGSVADYVVRYAGRPVLTVAPELDESVLRVVDPMANLA